MNTKVQLLKEKIIDIMSENNFHESPKSKLDNLLDLEKRYKLNTSDLIIHYNKINLSQSIKEEWKELYHLYIDLGGTVKEINQYY